MSPRHLQMLCMHAAIALLVAVPYMVSANDELRGSIDAQYAELEKLYVHLHQHPELSFQEKETSKRIAKELRDVGYSVTEGVGGFGVVAVLQNGVGPTVLLRADMDGLPVQESSGVSYASKATAVDELGNSLCII